MSVEKLNEIANQFRTSKTTSKVRMRCVPANGHQGRAASIARARALWDGISRRPSVGNAASGRIGGKILPAMTGKEMRKGKGRGGMRKTLVMWLPEVGKKKKNVLRASAAFLAFDRFRVHLVDPPARR